MKRKKLKHFNPDIFRKMLLLFIVVTLGSIGINWLLQLSSDFFYSELITPSDVFGALIVVPVAFAALMSVFIRSFKLAVAIVFMMLSVIGIYASLIWYYNAFVFSGCILIMLFNIKQLDKLWLEGFTHFFAGGYLLYCLGAYFIKVLYEVEVPVNAYAVGMLSVVTVYVWFSGCFDA